MVASAVVPPIPPSVAMYATFLLVVHASDARAAVEIVALAVLGMVPGA